MAETTKAEKPEPKTNGFTAYVMYVVLAGFAVMAAPVAAYAASTQQQLDDLQYQIDALQAQVDAIELTPGPQGETGPGGPEGPAGADAPGGGNAFQLTVAGDATNGNISDDEWNDACAALGGRAANTKDLLTLPWDLAGQIGGSWVRPYYIAANIDITGIIGSLGALACDGPGGNKPWTASVSGVGDRGLVANNGAARNVECGETHRITCVVPAP